MDTRLKKVSEFEWGIEKTGKMLVPGKIFASKKLVEAIEPEAIQQLANVATLKGIQKSALAMPDIHSGLLSS
ncbi:MAG: hypothetical protein WC413_02580 [Candidatus Nanoarchaeia archaeon]